MIKVNEMQLVNSKIYLMTERVLHWLPLLIHGHQSWLMKHAYLFIKLVAHCFCYIQTLLSLRIRNISFFFINKQFFLMRDV